MSLKRFSSVYRVTSVILKKHNAHLNRAALRFVLAAGGAVGPAAAGRQVTVVHHKVGVVSETAALQLEEDGNIITTSSEPLWLFTSEWTPLLGGTLSFK